jgi:hypothetical protein
MLTLQATARAMPMMIAALVSDGVKEGGVVGWQKAIKMT